MSRLDQFESLFRAAVRTVFRYEPQVVRKVLVLTDLAEPEAVRYGERVRRFLAGLPEAGRIEWKDAFGAEPRSLGGLLALVQDERPDLVCVYRNLYSDAWRWPYTLGDHVEVLTRVTDRPVLLLPRPDADAALAEGLHDTRRVMALSDRLTGDDRLVNAAVAFTQRGGRLRLAHVEDDGALARYLEVIGRVRDLDTDVARREIGRRLLVEAHDYIATVQPALADADVNLEVEGAVTSGHHLSAYRRLVREQPVDLLVICGRGEDRLALGGPAWPLAVELRDLPLLVR